MKKVILLVLAAAIAMGCARQTPRGNYNISDKDTYGYLFCHMSDYGQWTAYALSRDGLNYHDLKGGEPIFDVEEMAGIEGGTRDAYICRRHDGKGFLMVTTDMNNRATQRLGKNSEWENFGIDLLTSPDLVDWKSTSVDFRQGPGVFMDTDRPASPAYHDFSTICRVWAPQVIWDDSFVWENGATGGYMVYFSMLNRAEERYDRMYYCHADESFTRLTQPQLLIDWGYATIDADINWLESDGLFHLMIKKEGGRPGLFTSAAAELTGPWPDPDESDFVSFEGNKKCEGVSAFRIAGEEGWRIGYIEYSSRPKNYRICKADKYMRGFSEPQNIVGVNGPQHGSFLRVTKEEWERLEEWGNR